jgi:nicotinamide mononucleotide transporter
LSLPEICQQFIEGIKQTTFLEYLAVVSGIASVWFSRKENILVYPVGLISTTIYIYISVKGSLYGEASVNVYYTLMSVYGWLLWAKKDIQQYHAVIITSSTDKEWLKQILFFVFCYVVIFTALIYLKKTLIPELFRGQMVLQVQQPLPACGLWQRKKLRAGIGGSQLILLLYHYIL